jgi:hypothetical protein
MDLKELTTNFKSHTSIDYREFEFITLLDFAEAYYEGLLEVEKAYE